MPLNGTFISLCSHLTVDYCQRNRKLVLVCDMDETLLTESNLTDKIILRPKINHMLRNLRNHYELCLVTYSTRDRTNYILNKYLDPQSRLFGNRVLCREDIYPQFRNKSDAFFAHLPKSYGRNRRLLREVIGNINSRLSIRHNTTHPRLHSRRPPVWTYVVVLDDFPTAWSNLSTCIPVRPFHLINTGNKAKTTRNESAYVLSLQKFLLKLHTAVFRDPCNMINGERQNLDNASSSQTKKVCLSAHTIITRIKRHLSHNHHFQTLCHLDPYHLFDYENSATPSYKTNGGIFKFCETFSMQRINDSDQLLNNTTNTTTQNDISRYQDILVNQSSSASPPSSLSSSSIPSSSSLSCLPEVSNVGILTNTLNNNHQLKQSKSPRNHRSYINYMDRIGSKAWNCPAYKRSKPSQKRINENNQLSS
uniref:FCP1 homology domain-containing protein n=1 Tax=Trichobilharzia regenti TaxID=157069 RepID=A0AA85J2I7_TRIRE|nr:unnamed protein product [Trichobilharzia regenti]